jgi:hypothetical protein
MLKHQPLRLGFIGGGLSSAVGQTHYCAATMDGRWRIDAGAFSRSDFTNYASAAKWNVNPQRVYADWRAFIDQESSQLDAVAVLTPTPDHVDMVVGLLNAGIPVICEKALVASVAQLQSIENAYRANKHFLAVTYNYSGYPLVRELRALIQQGKLGKIQQIHIEMPQEGLARPPAIAGQAAPPQSWRLKDGDIPTICLDLGVHMHHLVHFLCGAEPLSVMAEFAHNSQYPDIVDNVMMWLRYSQNMQASFWMTKTAIGYRNGLKIRVLGSEGSAEWLQVNPEELNLNTLDGTRMIIDRASQTEMAGDLRYNRMKPGHPAGFVEAFANYYSDIADALVAYKKGKLSNPGFVAGFDIAKQGIELFAAARQSTLQGGWQNLRTAQVAQLKNTA